MSFGATRSEEFLIQPPKKMKSKQDIKYLMDKIFHDLQETREAGQKEYAHDSDNAFGNFERLATQLGLSKEKILWVYVQKHIDGVVSYLNGHKSQREDVRGRIKDIMVYLVLLWGMIDDNDPIITATEIIERDKQNVKMESEGAKKHKFFEAVDQDSYLLRNVCKNCKVSFDLHKHIDTGLRECPI